jgi:hypothetical protein
MKIWTLDDLRNGGDTGRKATASGIDRVTARTKHGGPFAQFRGPNNTTGYNGPRHSHPDPQIEIEQAGQDAVDYLNGQPVAAAQAFDAKYTPRARDPVYEGHQRVVTRTERVRRFNTRALRNERGDVCERCHRGKPHPFKRAWTVGHHFAMRIADGGRWTTDIHMILLCPECDWWATAAEGE